MDSEVVVPVDPIEQGGAQLLLGGEPPARDELPFQDVVRRLHHGVVVRVAGPGDRPIDPEGGQDRVDLGVAELRPAVGVEHLDPGERELDVREGGLHERRVLAPTAGAAHDLPVVQVDEQADVAPARSGAHVGEVGRHVGARAVAVEAPAEHVGGVGRGGGARGPRPAPGIRAGQAILPQYPAYPAPGGRYPRPRERHLEPAGAVTAARRTEGPEHVGLYGVGRRRRGRVGEHVVVGGARHAEDAALR